MQEQEHQTPQEPIRLLHSKVEAAQMLNVSLRTIDNLIAYRELAPRRIGRRVLIPHSEILRFVRVDHRMNRAA